MDENTTLFHAFSIRCLISRIFWTIIDLVSIVWDGSTYLKVWTKIKRRKSGLKLSTKSSVTICDNVSQNTSIYKYMYWCIIVYIYIHWHTWMGKLQYFASLKSGYINIGIIIPYWPSFGQWGRSEVVIIDPYIYIYCHIYIYTYIYYYYINRCNQMKTPSPPDDRCKWHMYILYIYIWQS